MTVRIEISGRRIAARIPYAGGEGPIRARRVSGARWSPDSKVWTYALDWASCVSLRNVFGDELEIGPQLWAWAANEQQRVAAQRKLAKDPNAGTKLSNLQKVAPKLNDAISKRPYQVTGAEYISIGRNVILADEMRLGKTLEILAGLMQAHPDPGNWLIMVPKTAILSTWVPEIQRWLGEAAAVIPLIGGRDARQRALAKAKDLSHTKPRHIFVVCNIEMCRIKGVENNQQRSGGTPMYPEMFNIAWDGMVIDESHMALVHRTGTPTQTRVGMARLSQYNPDAMRVAASGTPFRGKLHQIWGTLNWIKPEYYSSYWRWVETYFDVMDGDYSRDIGLIKDGMKQAFYDDLGSVILRRTTAEVRPEVPETIYCGTPLDGDGPVAVWLNMEGKQKKQYEQMVEEAIAELAKGGEIIAASALAELTRCKQLASAAITRDDEGKIQATGPSNKLGWILEKLPEMGKVVVASQFTKLLNFLGHELTNQGYAVTKITGGVSQEQRAKAAWSFQNDDLYQVMLLNTAAGGVSLTLDAADTMIVCDETWNPNDQQQLEARITPTGDSKVAPAVYYLKTLGTVEEGIARDNQFYESLTRDALDARRGVEVVRNIMGGKGGGNY